EHSCWPTLVQCELLTRSTVRAWQEVGVRAPWLLHVLHGTPACRRPALRSRLHPRAKRRHKRLQPRPRQPATAQPGFPIAAEAAPTGQAGQRFDVSIARDGVAKTSARARRILGIRRAPLARHLAAIAWPNSYTAGHASRDIAHTTSRCDNAFAFL